MNPTTAVRIRTGFEFRLLELLRFEVVRVNINA